MTKLASVLWFGVVAAALVTFAGEFRPWVALWVDRPDVLPGGTAAEYRTVGLLVPAAAVVTAIAWAGLGALIYRRRGRDAYGFAVSLLFVVFGLADTGAYSLVDPTDQWSVPARVLHVLAITLLIILAYMIPNGRFAFAWTRWLGGAFGAWMAIGLVVPAVDPLSARGIWQLLFLAFLLSTVVALWLRYARVATPTERLQIKWLLFGAIVSLAVYATASIVEYLWRPLGTEGAGAFVLNSLLETVYALAMLAFALAYAVSILRYRLYDIDLVINRALVYGATTAGIAIAFFAGIVVLQAVLRPLTSGSELAVAASTLVSFGLFQPLRRRFQSAVDRRFYRSRYDAARTLDAFSVRLRDEVDLDAVRGGLLEAVRDTVHPGYASVWLRGAR